jgi:outer membrane protein assembly factor BamB
MNAIIQTFTLSALLLNSGYSADWPAFRGPTGDGVSTETSAPIRWSGTENIKWATPLPQPGNGSPIVVGQQVLLTSVEDADGLQRSLYSFDTDTGKQQWVQTVVLEQKMPTHKTNPYGASTPASDGKHVVVWHGSGGLHAYSMTGKPTWHRGYGKFQHMWGYANSPVIHEGKVILYTGPGMERSFVTVLDLETGKTIWEKDEPFTGNGEKNDKGQYQGSWCTPTIHGGRVLLAMPTRINAYELADGALAWTCSGVAHDRGDLGYSSLLLCDDLVFYTGGFRGPMLAVKTTGSEDVTDSRLYRIEKQPQSIGSGVFVDGLVYRPNAGPGTIDCIDPKTGEIRWSERAGDAFWASIIRVGDHLYATSQSGQTTVFKANPDQLETVAVNSLQDRMNATPAPANGRLYLRGFKKLYCVE